MASNDEQRSATTILTTAAQSIAARLIANETTAKFTKAEISTTNLFNQSVTELQVLTSLDNVQQTADINTVTVINNNTVNVNVAIDQTKAPNNYQMNSVGLFAVDGDGKEVLYSVTVLKDPVYIHQDAMGSALGIDLETVVGQSSNVDLSINPAGAVTNEALKVTLADYVKTDDVKSLIPATVIDGSKPADFKEPVTLEKGAVDGEGNAIATTKDVSDGDATTLKSAKDYADTKISGKADDSTVVHTADMRKPASDVAGIEEVSALQTQVDNSAVGTNLVAQSYLKSGYLDRDAGGIVSDGGSDFHVDNYIPTNGSTVFTFSSPDYVFKGSPDCSLAMYDSDKKYLGYQQVTTATQTLSNPNTVYIRFSINFVDEGGTGGLSDWLSAHRYKLEKGSVATDWCPNPSEILTKSDDSKVAHLSGANNFDTVPTVNNNPLLLASSLPSDLARLSQDVNFTAKLQQNGQDVALANNTIARNPDTGVVSEPTDFTKLTVNGGKSVATSDDLKSLEASAWKLLVNSDATTAFYRLVDGTLYISGYARVGGNGGNTYASLTIVSQLPTELQNKVWTIQKKMTVGLNSGDYAMTAGLSFGKDSSLSATSSVPTGWTHDGIVIFNNSYTQS